MGAKRKLTVFAWVATGYTALVIMWGAFVRATGSGAGCGAHWPLCNGEVIPRAPQLETIIELTHRLSSGLLGLLVAALIIWVWRRYPAGSLVRLSAALAGFFTLTEALIGAALVLFGLVADNDTIQRAVMMMVHLVNTFLLMGSLGLTAWWAGSGVPVRLEGQDWIGWGLATGLGAVLLLGASGAVAALGDTLYPSSSLAEGIRQDFDAEASLLIRLRIFHPAIAIIVGAYLAGIGLLLRKRIRVKMHRRLPVLMIVVYVVQLGLGALNVILLAPVWMQLVHLLVSVVIWLCLVLSSAAVLGSAHLAPRVGNQQIHQRVDQAAE